MPKVKKPREEQMALELAALVKKYKVLRGLQDEELARGLGISVPTYYRKIKNGGSLTLTELRMLRRRLQIPWEELSAVIGV